MTIRSPLLCAALCALALSVRAQTAAPPAEPAVHTVTGNAALVSDYRFRGISQTWRRPAIQGGIDYSHISGFYLGNWNSSVSSNSYNNGASLEMDFYGGWKFAPLEGATLDLGVLQYYYPGARLNSAPATPTRDRYNNTEVYAGWAQGPFSAKLSVAATDYFGLDGTTAAYAYFSSLPSRGSSRGTAYLDLNYNVDLGNQLTLGLHAGHTAVRHYGDLSYTDYKVALTKEIGGFSIGAALVGTDADKRYYQVGDSSGGNPKRIGKSSLVLSASKTF